MLSARSARLTPGLLITHRAKAAGPVNEPLGLAGPGWDQGPGLGPVRMPASQLQPAGSLSAVAERLPVQGSTALHGSALRAAIGSAGCGAGRGADRH